LFICISLQSTKGSASEHGCIVTDLAT